MLKRAAIVLATLGVFGNAQAKLIDDFSAQAQEIDTDRNNPTTPTTWDSDQNPVDDASGTIATNRRDVFIGIDTDATPGGSLDMGLDVLTGPGHLALAIDDFTRGVAIINWNGDAGPPTGNDGSGNPTDPGSGTASPVIDLTDGLTSDGFLLDVVFSDNGMDFTIEVVDASQGTSSYSGSIAAGIVSETTLDKILFTDFMNGGGNADSSYFDEVQSISLKLESPTGVLSSDVTISRFYTDGPSVPEPMTITLVGAGLAGLGAMRRRARRKS